MLSVGIWQNVAILLTVTTVALGAPAQVTTFTFTAPSMTQNLVVDVGATVSFRCQMNYNTSRAPLLRLRKTVMNSTFFVADNDVFDPPFADEPNRYVSTPLDTIPNGADVYDWTINSVKVGDTGNYTCYTGSGSNISAITISLNVSAEPTQFSFFLDNELLPQSSPVAINKKVLMLGQSYRLRCVASGGNPFPNVTVTSGSRVLTPSSVVNTTIQSDATNPIGAINRSSAVEVSFVMSNMLLGLPINCSAGSKNASTFINSFIPIADNILPQFQCQDQFTYDSKQKSFNMTCKVFAQNITSYYVSWRSATANSTLRGEQGNRVTLKEDNRYSLLVTAPQGNDIWWTMVLLVENPSTVTDLSKNTYNFVATTAVGQAVHPVTVKISDGGGSVSGGSTWSMFGFQALLLWAVAALIFSRL